MRHSRGLTSSFSRSRGIATEAESGRAAAAGSSTDDHDATTTTSHAHLLPQYGAVESPARPQKSALAAGKRFGVVPAAWWPGKGGELWPSEGDVADAPFRGKFSPGQRRAVILDSAPTTGPTVCASACTGSFDADWTAFGFIAVV